MLILLINLLILLIIVVDLVDMLVDTASLPQDMTPADLTTMLLLVNHGSTVVGGVVLHGHVVPLLHVVAHLAVGVEHKVRLTDPALVHTLVCPVR